MGRDPAQIKALAGVHVLVVDGYADVRELLAAVLSYCGAFVVVAESAREALDHLSRTRADIVITDVALPGEDGYWLVREIRARGDHGRTLPVVALSAGREHGAERVLAGGFDAHFPKPVDPWELCRSLATLARKA